MEVEFRKKRSALLQKLHKSKGKGRRVDNNNTANTAGGGAFGGDEKTKLVELRRDKLLMDGFRRLSTATQGELALRLKFLFKGEDGIDSGGVGKEAYLLLSRAAAMYASPAHRGWMYAPDRNTGSLFFSIEEDSGTVAPTVPAPKLSQRGSKKGSFISTSTKLSGGGEKKKRGSGRRGSDALTGTGQDGLEKEAATITSITKVDEASLTELSKIKGPAFCKFLGRLFGKAVSGTCFIPLYTVTGIICYVDLLIVHCTYTNVHVHIPSSDFR